MRPVKSNDLYLMKWAREPQISPDGAKVLFEVKSPTEKGGWKSYKTQIYLAHQGSVRPFTTGIGNDTYPRWSPSASKVSFLSEREQDGKQLYVLPLEGGEAIKLTSVKGGIHDPVWSPDGKSIAFCAFDRDKQLNGNGGQYSSDVRVITTIRHKLNERGFLPKGNYQIFVLEIDSGKVKQITSGPYDCRQPAWSPDSKHLAFVSSRFQDHELSRVRDIWMISVTDEEMRQLTSSDSVLYSPSWSPDGKSIACYGHDNEYKGATVPGVCLLDLSGQSIEFLTSSQQISVGQSASSDVVPSSPSKPVWSVDGKTIYFTALNKGKTHLYSIDTQTQVTDKLTSGNCTIYGWSKSANSDKFAAAITSYDTICDIWSINFNSSGGAVEDSVLQIVGSKGEIKRLTNLNQELLDSVRLTIPEEIEVEAQDGKKLQAWVMKPMGLIDGNKYPVILEIHGGPHSAYGYAFFHEFQMLSSRGYGVIFGNPRGSTGYGQEFVAATRHDWGGEDYRDLMAITDYAAKLPWVDQDKMGVTGGSYGGYMTNWIIGHTNRFKAAVSQRSTCNRFSQFGTSDVAYMNGDFEFDGDPWDNPHAYLDRSPIMYVGNVETPLLLIHSEEDLRCPISQADEMFVALKKLKKPVIMIRFAGENHNLSRSGKPIHRVERLEYITAWFDRYIGPGNNYSLSIGEPVKTAVELPCMLVAKDGKNLGK